MAACVFFSINLFFSSRRCLNSSTCHEHESMIVSSSLCGLLLKGCHYRSRSQEKENAFKKEVSKSSEHINSGKSEALTTQEGRTTGNGVHT